MRCAPALILVFAILAAAPAAGQPASHVSHAQTPPAVRSVPPATANTAEAYYLFLRGRELEADDDVESAIAAFKRAAELAPTSGDILAELAALYARHNRAREAIAAAEQALRVAPDTLEAHSVLGSLYAAYAQSGEGAPASEARAAEYAAKAIPHLESVQKARGSAAEAALLFTLGRMYLHTGAYDNALAAFLRFNEREPDAVEGFVLAAEALVEMGRTREAAPLLERAAAREPSFYPALAQVYERDGQWPQAASAYERAAQAGTDSADLRTRWARALLSAERVADRAASPALLQRAATVLEDGRRKFPGDASVILELTHVYERQQRWTAAEQACRTVIARDPANAAALDDLGDVLIRTGRRDEAVAAWRRALDANAETIDRAAIERKIRAAGESVVKK